MYSTCEIVHVHVCTQSYVRGLLPDSKKQDNSYDNYKVHLAPLLHFIPSSPPPPAPPPSLCPPPPHLHSLPAQPGPLLLLPQPGEVGLLSHGLLQSLVRSVTVTGLELLHQQCLQARRLGRECIKEIAHTCTCTCTVHMYMYM